MGCYLAAICAAPTLLAHLGLLDRRSAVCYPGMEGEMGSAVVRPECPVVVDGRIITARSAAAPLTLPSSSSRSSPAPKKQRRSNMPSTTAEQKKQLRKSVRSLQTKANIPSVGASRRGSLIG